MTYPLTSHPGARVGRSTAEGLAALGVVLPGAAIPPTSIDRPAAQRVFVPDWHPAKVNKLLRMHWAKRARLLKSDAQVVSAQCRIARVTLADARRRVTLRLTLEGNDRECDDDNAWKSVLDALVACGALIDDSPRWVEKRPVEFNRATRRATTIVLEELQCATSASR